MTATAERLFEGADWDFATLQRIHDACEEIARTELGLDTYPNQIEVITAEQMLDAYSSVGMPLFYKHWSFGRHFAYHEAFAGLLLAACIGVAAIAWQSSYGDAAKRLSRGGRRSAL
jgi:spore cortex formation protein SpoVR/YcgB (stage V sporulation)